MDERTIALKAAGVQFALVAVISIALAIALPRSFFEDWGWLAGPSAWMLCAYGTARILRLPVPNSLVGAALAGLPSLLAVVIGVHWLGAVIAVALFGLWCGFGPGSHHPGGVTEWLKVHDWNRVGGGNCLVGSNPTLSAERLAGCVHRTGPGEEASVRSTRIVTIRVDEPRREQADQRQLGSRARVEALPNG